MVKPRVSILIALCLAVLTGAPSALADSTASEASATHYYVSLGDSLAASFQPNGDFEHGYAEQLYAHLNAADPKLVAPISASRAADSSVPTCTIAAPAVQATVEVRLPNAADFCELVAQALAADDVFQGPVVVASGLWHYPDAVLSCRLQFRNTHDRLVIHNSTPACAWFMRRGSGWHGILRRAAFSGAREPRPGS
jgi:hypothetical protein